MTSTLRLQRVLALVVCLGTGTACSNSDNAHHGEAGVASAGGEAGQPACMQHKKKLRSDDERLSCLLEVAGAGHVFRGSDMRDSLRSEIMPRLELFAPEVRQRIAGVIDASFDDEALERRFRQLFMARYDSGSVNELLDFYGTPIGSRLAAQRDEEATAEEMQEWFESHTPSDQRIDQVAEILQASHALESVAVMVRLPVEGLVSVLTPLETNGPAPTDEQISELLIPAIENAQTAVAAHTIYAMRVFDDKELEKLAAFEKGPAAQWYHEGLLVSVSTALGEAFAKLSQAVREATRAEG